MASKPNNGASRRTAPRRDGWLSGVAANEGEPKYLAIARKLAEAVESGELAPGDRLPTQRHAADTLGVDLTTITRAYAHARTMGVLEGEVGRGTFVRGMPSPSGPLIDLSMNLPPAPAVGRWRDLLSRGLVSTLRNGDPYALMTYRSGMGSQRERRTLASWLAPLLGDVDPQRVILTPGAQASIAGILPMLVKRGECVLAEPFTYPGFLAAARLQGVDVLAMACDDQGPLPGPLEAQIKRQKPRAIYINPTLQNPTTRTVSLERRHALASLAQKYALTIIEDDPYGLLAPDITPIARLAPERVVYISTFSKCISPGLRSAIVVAPPSLHEAVREAMRATSLMPTPVWSDLVVGWIEDGTAKRIVQSVVSESAARMKIARRILPARVVGGPHGFHVWLEAPAGWTEQAYTAAAHAQGVVTVASATFAASGSAGRHVRVSLGAPPDRDVLERGLRSLAALEKA